MGNLGKKEISNIQPSNKELAQIAQEKFEPLLHEQGYFLEEITCEVHSKEKFLTVFVDRIAPINLDEIAAISRALSQLVDESSEFGEQPFNLEVTTPGVDRPLTLPRHWEKNKGRLVRVMTQAGKEIKGRIGEVSQSQVEIDGTSYPYSDFKRALIEIEFKSTVKQGE
jgi:ribosome maturation factor RimP